VEPAPSDASVLDVDAPDEGLDRDPEVVDHPTPMTSRRWWWWVGGITAVGFVIRLVSVLGDQHRIPGGDSAYYFHAARLLVEGKGFINPSLYALPAHHAVQTSSWPPLFVFISAVPQALGFHSYLADRLWLCVFGSLAMVLVACAGKEIGGRRLGLIAAALVAIYPNIWMSIDVGLSETMTPIVVAWVLWMAYRFWRRPSLRTTIWFAISIGITMLGRDELSLLAVLLFVPLVLLARSLPWRRRFELIGIGALIMVLCVAPWVGFNLSRFDKPVFISTGFGITLASANCPATYTGFSAGYWSFACAVATPLNHHADESVQSSEAQAYATKIIRAHLGEMPQVEADRLGRAFGLFRPLQQISLDSTVETRPYHWALAGLGMYYVLVVSALGGTWVLMRRKIPVFPLWVVGLNVVVSVLITFGNTRYRTPIEVPLVLLSSALYAFGFEKLKTRRTASPPLAEPVSVAAS